MSECDSRDIAIKSFFLGPQAENGPWLRERWAEVLENWLRLRQNQFPHDGCAISPADQELKNFQEALGRTDEAVARVLRELEAETPKFTPRYIGHMVSEVSLPALLGHVCALLHNPNNTSREVSRVTSRLEDEAIADLAAMIGFPDSAQGHFTSGGTVANFEALWRAVVAMDRRLSLLLALRKRGLLHPVAECIYASESWIEACQRQHGISPDELHSCGLLGLGPWEFGARYHEATGSAFAGPVVLVPGNKHYSWEKAVSLMGLGDRAFRSVSLDASGRLDLNSLRAQIDQAVAEERPVAMVVSVAGTTELGEVDPVDGVSALLSEYRARGVYLWHHVDAAYGGYYASLLRGPEGPPLLAPQVVSALRAIADVDSVTLDPHKLGYVPYACGAFLARDPQAYRTRHFQAEYLQAANKSRWAHTLEGSRSGAGVTATWLSNRTLGLNAQGYGRLLKKGIEARQKMELVLKERLTDVLVVEPADLNILCFSVAPRGARLSAVNELSNRILRGFEASPHFSVSRTTLHARNYSPLMERLAAGRGLVCDVDHWVQIRLVLMNPFVISKECKTDFMSEFAAEVARHLASEL